MEVQRQEKVSKLSSWKGKLSGGPRWLKWALGIGLIILAIVGFVLAKRDGGGIPVQTEVVKKQAIEQSVMASGRLESAEKQEFFTPVDSTLMDIAVEVGDRVTKGQVMGRLDTQELGRLYQQALSRLAGLEADLARAKSTNDQLTLKYNQAAYEKANNKMDRTAYLYREGAITLEDLEQAKVEFTRAEADYQEALVKTQQGVSAKEVASLQSQVDLGRQEVAQAKERLDLATFVAVSDGVVLFVGAEKGNRVLEGTRLLVVGSEKNLEVTANVNEIDAGTLQVGQPVTITCTSLPEQVFKGKVTRVAAVALQENNANNTNNSISVPVTIQLQGATTGLKPGYTVDMNIITMDKKSFLVVPFEALVTKNGEKSVYVVEKGLVKKRKVITEKGNELYDIVKSGLKEGEEIILSPSNSLKEGQRVSVGEQYDQGK